MPLRMPAEWEPHEATWLAWPHEVTDWPGKFAAIPWVYGDIVRRLARVEIVRILVNDPQAERKARAVLRKCGADLHRVEFFHHPTNRSWTRDYAPTLVRSESGEITALNWIFNGWAKYDNYRLDDAVPRFVADQLRLPRLDPGVVLEGGMIDVNGAGALLTTEECLLSAVQCRNPGLDRAGYEKIFAEYFGAREVIWLRRGIAGDDTHGHVDDIARFTDPGTIVVCAGEEFADNLDILRRTAFRIVTLPMPEPLFFAGQRLPASYANFYIANGLVLVPTFNDPNDRPALNTLAELFPDREVVGIASTDLVLGLGTLHCMTQQQPA